MVKTLPLCLVAVVDLQIIGFQPVNYLRQSRAMSGTLLPDSTLSAKLKQAMRCHTLTVMHMVSANSHLKLI